MTSKFSWVLAMARREIGWALSDAWETGWRAYLESLHSIGSIGKVKEEQR